MSKLVSQLFVSLDGVVESPERWHLDYYNEEMQAAVESQIEEADILLLGRTTYEVFAASWPNRGSDVPLADRINSMPKLVASTNLDTLHWQNSTLIRGNVTEELTRLKQQPGKHITISGSPTLVRSLLRDHLVDELQLLVHPVALGSGSRLFQDEHDHQPFELIDATAFKTGVLYLRYRPLAGE
jgi:dihydrofolate reductase